METIGPYRIQAGPFRGGFGEVYHVFDTDSGDEFALKTLSGALLPDSPALARFRSEIATWISIPTHPNVVRALRAFDHLDRPYVLIEWIASRDLAANWDHLLPRAVHERQMYGAYRVIEVMRQLCAGLGHIHAQGYVHGDVKPGNVMMWSGSSPQVTDFGLARVPGSAMAIAAGTRRYMAPELLDGGPTTGAVDVYSVGVIFRDLLRDADEHLAGRAAVTPIIEAMVEDDPGNRPASFAEIESELAAIVEQAPVAPGIPRRTGERLTWDERHLLPALPERGQYHRALTLASAGRYEQAAEEIEGLLEKRPGDADGLLLRAEIAMESGRSEAAVAFLERIALEEVTNPRILHNLVMSWLRLQRPDRAEEVVERLAKTGGPPEQVAYLRGWIAGEKGYVSEEIEHYQQALELGGDDDVRYRLAQAFKHAGLVEDALSQFRAIATDHPGLGTRVTVFMARIYVDTKRFREAKTLLREALQGEQSPDHACYLYSEQGYLLRAEGLYEAAVESYRRALEQRPDDRAAREGLELAERGLSPDRRSRGVP